MILAAFPRSGYAPLIPTGTVEEPEPEPEPVPPPEAWLTHPGISEGITQMLVDGDRLYLTHGTTWNGGNYPLAWVDLPSGQPVTGPVQPTEGFAVTRKIGGRLFIVWADPTGPWESPQGYTYSDDGATWQHKLVAPSYHMLDLREHDGDLFLSGAGPIGGVQHAQVWRSRDNGDTWESSLATSEGGGLTRVYSLMPANGGLWCIVSGTDTLYRLEGETWVAHPEIPKQMGYEPVWQGFREAITLDAGGVTYGKMGAFDGTRFLGNNEWLMVHPAWADATHVYGVQQFDRGWSGDYHIVRTPLRAPGDSGGVQWEEWMNLGNVPVLSATLHDGHVYVGGTQGRIWRYPTP